MATKANNVVSLPAKRVVVKTHTRKPRKTATYACDRCGGNGRIDHWSHVANGVCFACGGTGKITCKPVKAAVDPHADLLVSADRMSTDKQWMLMRKLTKNSDAKINALLKKAGAKVSSQRYVNKTVMSDAIKLALSA